MKKSPRKPQPDKQPDWEQLESDVIRKIKLLRVAWEHTSTMPEIHSSIARDLFIPAIKHLAAFCVCVDEGEPKFTMPVQDFSEY